MNLLIISPRFNETSGGDGLYAYRLAESCVRAGHAVTVLTIKEEHFIQIQYENRSVKNNIQLEKIGTNIWNKNFYSRAAKKSLERILTKTPVEIVHIHGIHQFFTISCISLLAQYPIPVLLTIHDYKILCGNAGFFSDRNSQPCLKCLSGNVFPPITERCKRNSLLESVGASVQMGIWKHRKAYEHIDCYHCGSTFVFDLLHQNSEIKAKLKKIRFPYLTQNYNHSDTGGRKKENINIVFIGRLVPHKGITIFADAVRDIDHIPIDIIGDGPLGKWSREILYHKKNVTFHGWKTHTEMGHYLTVGSIVVVPYLAYETFCYVVLEAMMRGACVVASSRGAIPELVQDGHNGILIQDPTSSHFHEALIKLLENRDEIYRLGENAVKITGSLQDLDHHTSQITDLYRQLIDQGSIHI